jgi:glycosyltransferase involved in cell wall biosynthesis
MEQSLALREGSESASALQVVRIVADYPLHDKSSYGLQPVYQNLSRVQALRGHNVQVIARRYRGEPSKEVSQGVTIHRVGTPFTVNAIARLRNLLGKESRSIIHTHSTSGFFLSGLKKTMRAPIVSHVHGTTYSAATPVVLTFGNVSSGYSQWGVTTSYLREKALWSAADRIAAVSSSVKSDLESKYDIQGEKIRLVYNGVDATLFRPVPKREVLNGVSLTEKKVVLYVGHFGPRKGVSILIRAMQSVANEVRDSILLCVGGVPPWLPQRPYTSYLRGLIQENGLEGRVLLLDRVPNDELPEIYSTADVFVLPSYYEAFPKVLIEAMACEKPVVTTDLGGTPDSVDEGVNGFLVPYGDTKILANRIIALLQDERLANRMGSAGRQRVLRDFTWDAVAERIDSIYREVLPR